MNGIFLNEITQEDLRSIIADEVRKALQEKPAPRKYTREQVAEMCHVTLATIHNWIRCGKLHPTKAGGRVLFDEEEINRLISRR